MALALIVDSVDAVVKPAENHLTGGGLKDAGDGNVDSSRDHLLGVIHHHHRTVIQLSDSLVVLFAFLENDDAHRFARQNDGLEGIGEFINVQNLDAM